MTPAGSDGAPGATKAGIVLSVLFLLLSACARSDEVSAVSSDQFIGALHDSHEFAPAGNPNPNARIDLGGFSILPPQGEHWIEEPFPPKSLGGDWALRVLFVKVLPQPQPEQGMQSAIAAVQTMTLSPQLRQLLQDQQNRQKYLRALANTLVEQAKVEAESQPQKFRVISEKAEPDYAIGYDCIRWDHAGEVLAVPNFEGKPFLLESHVYQCLDPSHSMLVQLGYSQRTPRALKPVDITSEGEGFLKSLRFAAPVS